MAKFISYILTIKSSLSVLVILSSLLLFSCAADKPNFFGNITYVSGQAFVLSPKDTKQIKANKGAKVFFEDQIRTESKSAVELQLKSYGLLRIGEDTLFSLSELNNGKRVEVRVDRGKAGLFINKLPADQELIVKTPTAIAAVRGTRFLISSDKDQSSKIALFDGAVELKNETGVLTLDKPGEVRLQKGMTLSQDMIEPLSPESIAEMNAMENMNAIQIPNEPSRLKVNPKIPKSPLSK